MSTFNGFDDLADDSFDAGDIMTTERPATLEAASKNESLQATKGFVEDCPKCRGTGVYRGFSSYGHQCFKCQGRGKLEFKTSSAQRAKTRQQAAQRKEVKAVTQLQAFEAAHPDVAAWWADSSFPFAVSLRDAAAKYDSLTPNQLAAARKCIAKVAEFQAKKVETVAKAESTTVDISGIKAAMNKAMERGLKNPKIRLMTGNTQMVMSLAKEHSVNAGAVYVKANDSQYMGKINNGHFYPSRDCDSDMQAAILKACETPEASAVAYGRITGSCSCCGRELNNAESIALGIGPVCRGKFFG